MLSIAAAARCRFVRTFARAVVSRIDFEIVESEYLKRVAKTFDEVSPASLSQAEFESQFAECFRARFPAFSGVFPTRTHEIEGPKIILRKTVDAAR